MPNLVIVNQPIQNRGDQAAHKALIRLLQQHPDINITVLSIDSPEEVEEFSQGIEGVNYITFPPFKKKWHKFCRQMLALPWHWIALQEWLAPGLKEFNDVMRGADYILCAPGGICMGGYKNWHHLWTLVNALALKKRTGIYARSIGPFRSKKGSDRLFKKHAVNVLHRVEYLSLRDEYSQQLAGELGAEYMPAIDTAFAGVPDLEMPRELKYLADKKYAIFVPNALYLWHRDFKHVGRESFKQFYRQVIDDLLSRGLNVVMLPQLFGENMTDRRYFLKLAADYDRTRVIVIEDFYDSDIQQVIVRHSQLVVGARYHSVIFAVNNRVPFVCLSYEHKMSETLRLLALEEYSLPLQQIMETEQYDLFKQKLNMVIQNRQTFLSQLETAKERAGELAQNAFDGFLKSLTDSSGQCGR